MSKAQAVTAENVDDLTDEQMAEVLAEMQAQEPAEEGEPGGEPNPAEKPAEQPTSEPEKGKKQDAEPEDVDDKAESVPFKRYDYERNRRRDLEKQREEENARWQKRFDELLSRTQPKPAEEAQEQQPQVPDINSDPLAAVKWTQEQLLAMQSTSAQREREAKEAEQAEAQYQQAFQQVNADYERANQADPTIAEAYNALQKSQGEELLAMGYTIPQAQQILRDTERQHVQFVAARGLDIGQYVKSLAAARGWRPGAAVTGEQQQAAAAQTTTTIDVAEAQKRAKSLSNGGGSPGVTDRPSAEQLLNMSDKDFDAFVEKYGMNAVLQG